VKDSKGNVEGLGFPARSEIKPGVFSSGKKARTKHRSNWLAQFLEERGETLSYLNWASCFWLAWIETCHSEKEEALGEKSGKGGGIGWRSGKEE
jgi:hypothetical protein